VQMVPFINLNVVGKSLLHCDDSTCITEMGFFSVVHCGLRDSPSQAGCGIANGLVVVHQLSSLYGRCYSGLHH